MPMSGKRALRGSFADSLDDCVGPVQIPDVQIAMARRPALPIAALLATSDRKTLLRQTHDELRAKQELARAINDRLSAPSAG